jgi:membrane protein
VTEPDELDSGKVLAALPGRLRPRAELVLGRRAGTVLLHTAGELARVQIFDRSMTLAAQAFTSVFPLLIMVGTLLGERARDDLDDLLRLPDPSARLLDDALGGAGSNAFGVAGSLIVILSATGLARALVRAYRVVWRVPGRRAGAAATGWQIGSVLLLAGFLVGIRLLGGLAGMLPAPRVGTVVVTALADVALAALLPRILLGPVVPWRRLLLVGVLFAAVMVGVRAGGSVYLPMALRSSADRYGTIGLAFTYIGWLYVLSFCLLLCAVLGGVLHAALDPAGATAGGPALRPGRTGPAAPRPASGEGPGGRSAPRPVPGAGPGGRSAPGPATGAGRGGPSALQPADDERHDQLGEADHQAADAGEQDQGGERQLRGDDQHRSGQHRDHTAEQQGGP